MGGSENQWGLRTEYDGVWEVSTILPVSVSIHANCLFLQPLWLAHIPVMGLRKLGLPCAGPECPAKVFPPFPEGSGSR